MIFHKVKNWREFIITNKVVVAITGMPGSGKGVFRRILKKMGYPIIIMGDVVREEIKIRGLKPIPENLGKVMLQLRASEGLAVIAKRCIPKIMKTKERIVGIDGVRSIHEVEEFKKYFPNFILIAIQTSPKKRYQRLFRRKRSDDPNNWETFVERDQRELKIGMGAVIAAADIEILNEGSLTEFRKNIHDILWKIVKDE